MKQEAELVLFAHLVLFSLEEAVATLFPPAEGGRASAEVIGPWNQSQVARGLSKVTFPIPISQGTTAESHLRVEFPELRPLRSLPGRDEEMHPFPGVAKNSEGELELLLALLWNVSFF